jgi:hypothetical protein
MSTTEGVSVPLGVDLGEFKTKLGEAGKLVENTYKGMGRAAGAARILSGAISTIGGASNSAASMAGNLLAGFAMGGPMGLAIGGVQALISVIKESREETEKAKKAAADWAKTEEEKARKTRDAVGDAREAVHDRQNELALLVATTEAEKEAIKGKERIHDLERQIAEVMKDETLHKSQRSTIVQQIKQEIEVVRALNAEYLRLAQLKQDRENAKGDEPLAAADVPGGVTVGSDTGLGYFNGVFAGGPGFSDNSVFGRAATEGDAEDEAKKTAEAAKALQVDIANTWIAGLDQMLNATELSAKSIARVFAQIATQMMVASGFAWAGPVGGLLGIGASFLPSAAGGWDVPTGINPITQLHSGEMVLPEAQADAVRAMANGRGAAPVQVTINAIDGLSVRDWIVRNGTDFSAGVRELGRQGR